ncbi:hypothetical protein SADUNF_Sadunf05G0113100 [Salix dunnii]|uniref:B-like cyclin n=1 Tax=Salix dunnii TaxID=1413687 RepID=A0A835N3M8_9ROSI|nr:hypothetical protein SADUNF_Sadunf05G0113100 [Salix dunnii]
MQSEKCSVLMVEKECQHLPNDDYLKRLRNGDLDGGARKEVVYWIAKGKKKTRSRKFMPTLSILSVNYLDRFLSAYELPKGNAWMMQLSVIYFMEFRPSEIAAAVSIAVVYATKTVGVEQAISVLTQPAHKVKLVPCCPKPIKGHN